MSVIYETANQLTVGKATNILLNPDKRRLSSKPPANPELGQIYLFENKNEEWMSARKFWKANGVKCLPKSSPVVKKRFFYHVDEKNNYLKKQTYELIKDQGNITLAYYVTGNATKIQLKQKEDKKENSKPKLDLYSSDSADDFMPSGSKKLKLKVKVKVKNKQFEGEQVYLRKQFKDEKMNWDRQFEIVDMNFEGPFKGEEESRQLKDVGGDLEDPLKVDEANLERQFEDGKMNWDRQFEIDDMNFEGPFKGEEESRQLKDVGGDLEDPLKVDEANLERQFEDGKMNWDRQFEIDDMNFEGPFKGEEESRQLKDVGGNLEDPFKDVEASLKEQHNKETSRAVVYCRKSNLNQTEVGDIITNPDANLLSTLPPSFPKEDEVYVYQYNSDSADKKEDWKCDNVGWVCDGVRSLSHRTLNIKKRFYHARHSANFYRRAYTYVKAKKQETTLVHYTGCHASVKLKPHGNSKYNLSRVFTRTFPSTLKEIGESEQPPKNIYRKMVSANCPAQVMSRKCPRSYEQVRNRVKLQKKSSRICHDDVYAAYELALSLEGFVLDIHLYPQLQITFGIAELFRELREVTLTGNSNLFLYYDTTFNCGDFYISTLLFQHQLFKERPIVSVAFYMHESKEKLAHEYFFLILKRKFPFLSQHPLKIVTDREKSIVAAIKNVFPSWSQFICWNHLIRDTKFWLQRNMSGPHDKLMYQNDVHSLLRSKSAVDFENDLYMLSENWEPSFATYFKNHIHDDIISKAGRWLLVASHIYNDGITTNPAESFNAQLERVLQHKEVRVDEFILSVYFLQNYTYKELLRGKCGLGDWHLVNENNTLSVEDVEFPSDCVEPDQIIHIIRNTMLKSPSSSSNQLYCHTLSKNSLHLLVFKNMCSHYGLHNDCWKQACFNQ
ncbi:uncharacterized protein LOC143452201 isoform X1 [Clavelina lepadiformis]|uniref:uncharacterized protein LOC143452201 isoform X1 n=1 Tax=Clavelina lepadiformis TaxID=159417 RepID=UPI00404296DF